PGRRLHRRGLGRVGRDSTAGHLSSITSLLSLPLNFNGTSEPRVYFKGGRGRSAPSGVIHLEFLNALIARIRHEEVPLAIDRHTVGPGEPARVLAGAPESKEDLSSGREELDPLVQAADADAVLPVHEDPDRPERIPGETRLHGAE